jgi:hypothetical protein
MEKVTAFAAGRIIDRPTNMAIQNPLAANILHLA